MTTPDPAQAVVLRTSPLALIGVVFTLLVGTPLLLAAPGFWSVLLVVPVLVAVWVLRVRTTVTTDGMRVRTTFGSRTVGWEQVRGIHFRDRGWGRALLVDDEEVALPAVRFPHLPLLAELSGGRVPDPFASAAADDETTTAPATDAPPADDAPASRTTTTSATDSPT